MTSTMGATPAPESTPAGISAPVVPDAHTAGLAATSGNSTEVTASTTVGTLADLKNKAPQVYKAMMQGIAQTIIQEWDRHEKARKDIAKEFER